MTRKERAAHLAKRLPEIYPDAHCELNYSTPFELLVATILSAQCTDKRVNIVTKELFRHQKLPKDFVALSQEALEKLIHSTGFYRNKAKNIRAAAKMVLDTHAGKVPRTLAELAALPGVGRKTANVVLGNVFDINEGVVVDTHVTRLSLRLMLTKHRDPVKIEQDLMKLFPQSVWMLLSHWFIWHGRRRCYARNPDCAGCEIRDLCPTRDQWGKPARSSAKK
ncbi:MAG: endonuclease III [Chthoniobacterales bacterium]